jgi:hypothetical protein
MTLIVAGRSLRKGVFGEQSTLLDGLFAASDTSITEGNTILVSGFKKVIEIPIRAHRPVFNGEMSNGYHGFRYAGFCFLAFAGSTLVAQHFINSITNHLGNLYPVLDAEIYRLAMPCEEELHLRRGGGDYDDSMFLDSDLDPLLTAEFVCGVVRHSIQACLERAKKHDGMKRIFRAFSTDFILGIRCPLSHEYHLYQYNLVQSQNGEVDVLVSETLRDAVAVIGMPQRFSLEAQECFASAVREGKNTANEMHEFVARAIEDQNSIGVFKIGKPCALYTYDGGNLSAPSKTY